MSIQFNRLITLDPGLGGTGWSFWDSLENGAAAKPQQTGCLRPSRGEHQNMQNLVQRCYELQGQLESLCIAIQPRSAGVEFPVLFSGSAMSLASAGSGDLFKLTCLTGGLLAVLTRFIEVSEIRLLTPASWKGQMNKKILYNRVKLALGTTYPNHTLDAVGMGLSMIGQL
jgi:hypothetical protein